ncbi:D-aminoacyl-tRNA deacylase [Marinicella sp. W31]|uniref:D-aminoacyl-tRNA deacylase n=1 Tax=Marinicella sp. W31 TaxID=3023713 RepID=UPI003756B0E1
MIALIQRVSKAQVTVNNKTVGAINQGILALIGVERDDTEEKADKLLKKILNYRMFSDNDQRMNLSVQDIAGELLLVSQFTLVAETQKGNRPGFSRGATPELGAQLFDYLCQHAQATTVPVQTGIFAADMQVELINDGPVTFWLQT